MAVEMSENKVYRASTTAPVNIAVIKSVIPTVPNCLLTDTNVPDTGVNGTLV